MRYQALGHFRMGCNIAHAMRFTFKKKKNFQPGFDRNHSEYLVKFTYIFI